MTNEDNGQHRPWPTSRWSRGARFRFALAAMVLVPLLLTLFAAITMWLWNWLMPVIFNLPMITIWQAAGLVILSRILFRGGHFRGAGRRHWKRMRIRERMKEGSAEGEAV